VALGLGDGLTLGESVTPVSPPPPPPPPQASDTAAFTATNKNRMRAFLLLDMSFPPS